MADSSYSLTEVNLGSKLCRHDVSISQEGPRTQTELSALLLATKNQLLDLHTNVILNHPEGKCSQVHKCIATTNTSRGVFDGQVARR